MHQAVSSLVSGLVCRLATLFSSSCTPRLQDLHASLGNLNSPHNGQNEDKKQGWAWAGKQRWPVDLQLLTAELQDKPHQPKEHQKQADALAVEPRWLATGDAKAATNVALDPVTLGVARALAVLPKAQRDAIAVMLGVTFEGAVDG